MQLSTTSTKDLLKVPNQKLFRERLQLHFIQDTRSRFSTNQLLYHMHDSMSDRVYKKTEHASVSEFK